MIRLQRWFSAVLSVFLALAIPANACTRVTYIGQEGLVVTGRSMDWMVPVDTNLWAFPGGVMRQGANGDDALIWTSKYGSVIAGGYDAATTDGVNTKGLVANLLYLGTADYGARDEKRPALSVAAWAQYVLDNFATVDEAAKALAAEPFQIVAPELPGGFAPTLHLSISDASGDSAILEYIGGKLVIHHSRAYQVMTNEPSYDQQLALDAYWKDIGGEAMLPGTNRPADRFVRASYYLSQSQRTADPVIATTSMFSLMRNVSVPMGVSRAGQPNIAPTIWRTVSDQKNLVYYFESTSNPNIFWVSLDKLDLSAGQPTRRLDLGNNRILAGEASGAFAPAEPFRFLAPAP